MSCFFLWLSAVAAIRTSKSVRLRECGGMRYGGTLVLGHVCMYVCLYVDK